MQLTLLVSKARLIFLTLLLFFMAEPVKVIPITNLYLINQNYGPIPASVAKLSPGSSVEKYIPRKAFMEQLLTHISNVLKVPQEELPQTLKIEIAETENNRNLKVIDYFTGENIINLSGSILDEWNEKHFKVQGFLIDRWA